MNLEDILSGEDEECDHPLMERFRNPPEHPFLALLRAVDAAVAADPETYAILNRRSVLDTGAEDDGTVGTL